MGSKMQNRNKTTRNKKNRTDHKDSKNKNRRRDVLWNVWEIKNRGSKNFDLHILQINNGKNTLYASVSANPAAVLVRNEGWNATINPANKPATLPPIFLPRKKAGITARVPTINGP